MGIEPRPSKLLSWLWWKDYYTEVGKPIFSTLMETMGIDYIPIKSEWESFNGGVCPFCKGHSKSYVYTEDDESCYCLCAMLDWHMLVDTKWDSDIRTPVPPATLSEIQYPSVYTQAEKLELKKAVKRIKRFIKKPDKWLVLTGYFGTGKTHMLRVLNTVYGPMSVYLSTKDLEDMTHASRKADNMQYLYELLRYAPILLLDDLGAEHGGPLVKSMITRVVDARYEQWPKLPLVVATNMKYPNEIMEYIPRVGNRLADLEKVTPVAFSVRSYREIKPEYKS